MGITAHQGGIHPQVDCCSAVSAVQRNRELNSVHVSNLAHNHLKFRHKLEPSRGRLLWINQRATLVPHCMPLPAPPTMHVQQEHQQGVGNGNRSASAARSCSYRRGLVCPQVRSQFRSGDSGLTFDRQHKLCGHSFLGARQPIPDLRLCRSNAVCQWFLAASNLTCASKGFSGHEARIPNFGWITTEKSVSDHLPKFW